MTRKKFTTITLEQVIWKWQNVRSEWLVSIKIAEVSDKNFKSVFNDTSNLLKLFSYTSRLYKWWFERKKKTVLIEAKLVIKERKQGCC